MSSVKRRKLDGDLPSGLLKKKKKEPVVKEQSPAAPASTSPEPAALDQPEEKIDEEVPKTFKDLVRTGTIGYWRHCLLDLGYH
jgi:ATP-dependent RNA helicase DDX47/RRP3